MNRTGKYISSLISGNPITIQHKDMALHSVISSKSLVTLHPTTCENLTVGDFIFCRVKGIIGIRKIKAIQNQFFIVCNGNNRIGGRITRVNIFGECLLSTHEEDYDIYQQ